MKKLLLTLATCALCNVAFAQVGTTIKEGAKATSEKAQQLGDQAKASVESQPSKTVDKRRLKCTRPRRITTPRSPRMPPRTSRSKGRSYRSAVALGSDRGLLVLSESAHPLRPGEGHRFDAQ